MKLSEIESKNHKGDQPSELDGEITHDIIDILEDDGITADMLLETAMKLYFPHPGIETRELAEERFRKELKIALSDPNLCILIYSGILLEREGVAGTLPNISVSSYEKDLTFIIADEVIGMSIAKYISGDKGMFEYVRFDKEKPGILSKMGPFMDDVIAGLIGGVSANMYTRSMAEAITDDSETKDKPEKKKKQSSNVGVGGVIAG
ncbi:MAG: alpha-ribazole phosphatase CobZ [Methanosarcinaceae archaeon]|jgi:alpha-ribazole phosphatase CobZ|nr:alpha-ribazole phosphatase CobZ [Methanosarcinaceae archaeon]